MKTRRYDRNPIAMAFLEPLHDTLRSIAARMLPIHLSGWTELGTSPMYLSMASASTTTSTASSHRIMGVTR